jgi:malate dehydrogenase
MFRPFQTFCALYRLCFYAQSQIVPLISQSSHPLPASVDAGKLEALTKRIQFGGDEVVKAKDGAGSATLSMAYAGAEFAIKVIKAVTGEKGLVAPSYVHLDADKEGGAAVKKEIGKELDYFSANVQIGVNEFLCLCNQMAPY